MKTQASRRMYTITHPVQGKQYFKVHFPNHPKMANVLLLALRIRFPFSKEQLEVNADCDLIVRMASRSEFPMENFIYGWCHGWSSQGPLPGFFCIIELTVKEGRKSRQIVDFSRLELPSSLDCVETILSRYKEPKTKVISISVFDSLDAWALGENRIHQFVNLCDE